jgi:diguanylate cyclase (GGDEF)-like protein
MNVLQQLLTSDIKLPSPPSIAVKILEEVKKEEGSADGLAEIIALDPALVTKILRVANSSFYGVTSKVDTIQRAIAVIGLNALKNIALSFVIANGLRDLKDNPFSFDLFWKRSVTSAVAAKELAALTDIQSEDIFPCALLQDMGIVIMYLCRSDDYLKVLDEKRQNTQNITAVEKRIFKFDHQQAGAAVLQQWGLPPNVYGPIGYHHKPQRAPDEHRAVAEILNLADQLSSIYHGSARSQKLNSLKTALANNYHIDASEVDSLIDRAAEKAVEFLSFFDIDPGDLKPFSVILQEANTELGKLNLSYEQLLLELKNAKEKAEKLSLELKTANAKLREIAYKDPLTGLFNRRYFEELLKAELNRSRRYKHPLSIIIYDLDHFKRVNDSHGHIAGDQVLKTISAEVSRVIRSTDLVARYGGEEFIILLPETCLKGALILAERVRLRIAALKIAVGKDYLRLTVSAGVASKGPGSQPCPGSALIDAADKALYQSKNNGRNKISAANIQK